MSERINILNDKYKTKETVARQTINDSNTLQISSFPGVYPVYQGHFNEDGEWEYDRPKYEYNGWGAKNTRGEANNDRNSDIQSKINILNAKIQSCNSIKGELNDLKAQCQTSIDCLNEDVNLLNSVDSSLKNVITDLKYLNTQSGKIATGVYDIYNCNLKNLSSAINITSHDFDASADSSVIEEGKTKLDGYIQTGESIINGINSINSQLDEKITQLTNQKNSFENMKVYG